MTKPELAEKVAEQTGLSKKDAVSAVGAVFDTIIHTVAQDEDVQIIGFGTFTNAERAEREGRNPATGEKMTISASKSPKFKPGKAFKDAVAETAKPKKKTKAKK